MELEQIAAERAWRAMGLTDAEYARIGELLGRAPNWTELGMFAVLWSEHCAYKHSRALFNRFPTEGPQLLQGVGENAGVVDLGDGLAVTFKVESHNHPSAVEPFQGAATGVGGILRDIFTMGARPIAILDSLRFGPLEDERVRYLFGGVVSGISAYGNSVGVPTVGGEVFFDPAYRGNPLVNVMAVGLVRHEHVATAAARGVGNPVLVVGARTGRDGIHGASFASADLDEKSEERRPSVQVGDPFTEKLLIEACLELIATGVVVGIQDMGAAGLTSSSAEMAARAGSGIELDLDRVPLREEGMTPYEIMLSESQERMLVVPRKGAEEQVQEIFRRWGLEAAVVGHVTDDGLLRLRWRGEVAAEVPAEALSGGAPAYSPPAARPAWLDPLQQATLPGDLTPGAADKALAQLLARPNLADKAWVFEQYDTMVRTNTVVGPGSDAAVLRLPGTERGLALAIDCNARFCYLDPRRGARLAVAECALNLAASGARPLAITDGMNFGNPQKPEVYWQFTEAVEGIAEACRALGTPVTGGNVSFYNESQEPGREPAAIFPTPIIGMIGVLDDVRTAVRKDFCRAGDALLLLGEPAGRLGGSEYWAMAAGRPLGRPADVELERHARLIGLLVEAAQRGLIRSAHDLSDGGLAVACAEATWGGVGAEIELPGGDRLDETLFGEAPSRVLLAVDPACCASFEALAAQHEVPAQRLGQTGGERLAIKVGGRAVIDRSIHELKRIWQEALPVHMGARDRVRATGSKSTSR